MAPYESLNVGAQAVLLDVLHTLQRLEIGVKDQDKRLYLLEQYIQSGSISPVTNNSDRYGDVFSVASGSQQTPSLVTTPPQSPVSLYQDSIEKVRRKFELEDSDDEEEASSSHAPPGLSHQGHEICQEAPRPGVDAMSVSVYSQHPSQLALSHLALGTLAARSSNDPALPQRSPLRHQPGDEEQVSHDHQRVFSAGMMTVPYENALYGLAPSRVKPAEVYAGKVKQDKAEGAGMFVQVWEMLTSRRSWMGKVPQIKFPQLFRPEQQKADMATTGIKQVQKEEHVPLEFGFAGLCRALVLAFSNTHRSRPYIVA